MDVVVLVIGWLISAFGVGSIVSSHINKRIEKVQQKQREQDIKQNAVEKGVQALLRSEIIRMYNKCSELGRFPIYERENLEHLYAEYKALGGNGVVEGLVEDLNELPAQ